MKCPQCDGYGKVTYIVRSGNRIISKEVGECDYCYGTGEVNDWETESTEEPLTNEEYLRSCTTEQLADLMSRIVGCSNCPIPKDGRSCMGTYSGCWHEIIKWLKQPHTIKE